MTSNARYPFEHTAQARFQGHCSKTGSNPVLIGKVAFQETQILTSVRDNMSSQFHCPYRQSTLLQQALAPNKMRIAFLLGAGCPVSIRIASEPAKTVPLIPDIAGLTTLVRDELGKNPASKASYDGLLARFGSSAKPNIEEILSHLRALIDVIRDGSIDGMTKTSLRDLDKEICSLIAKVVGVDLPGEKTPYHQLATWTGGIARAHPVEVFTPNYDLLIEQAFESRRIPYFDGFIGSKQAFFDLSSIENDILPPRWARLWKLHGSINWWRTQNDDVVRRDGASAEDRQMIYPSHLKYDQSRRLPYLAMLDRLRDFLGRGQAVIVTCGYSFADQHLNEVILNGLRGNPTAMCFALMYSERAKHPEAVSQALRQPNLSVLAYDGAVSGTIERDWRSDEQASHPLHGVSVLGPTTGSTGAKGNCQFTLGDFKNFGQFLAQQLSRGDELVEENAA
jgi:SIR2-like domain